MTAHVTIIGAGLGGLTPRPRPTRPRPRDLIKVHEAESSPMTRGQGGLLDSRHQHGRPVLQAAGLIDEFRGLILDGRQALRLLDRHGNVLLTRSDNGTGDGPEVLRGELRRS